MDLNSFCTFFLMQRGLHNAFACLKGQRIQKTNHERKKATIKWAINAKNKQVQNWYENYANALFLATSCARRCYTNQQRRAFSDANSETHCMLEFPSRLLFPQRALSAGVLASRTLYLGRACNKRVWMRWCMERIFPTRKYETHPDCTLQQQTQYTKYFFAENIYLH